SGVAQILPKYDPSEDDNLVKASGVAQILPKYDPSEDDNLVKASGVAQILPKYDPSENDNLVKASGVAQILPKYDPSENDNLVKASGVPQINQFDSIEDLDYYKNNYVTQGMNELWEYNNRMQKYILNKNILNYMKELIGDNVKLLSDTIIHKPANYGAASPLHRDSPFWKGITPYTQISCWIPLQDVNEDNGCLGYIPGTHQDEEIENQPEKLMSEELSLSNEYKDKIKYIPIEAGDCLIHHGMILHGTGPNLTGKNRTAYVIHYMEGNSQSSGEDAFKNVKDCPYVLKDGVILEGLNV
ncbi:phytanoyl-CoA dioxygenase family protein, partial [Cytobacillus purgationiresistens]